MSKPTAVRVFEVTAGLILFALLAWLLGIYGLPGKVKANTNNIEENARRQNVAERNILKMDFQQRSGMRDSQHSLLKLDAIMGKLKIDPVTQPELPPSKLTDPNATPRR